MNMTLLKQITLILTTLLLACSLHAEKQSNKQPDIVFVLIDDLRWDAMSFLGHPYIETPNIDSLRSMGAHMQNAFVTTSICCPSRATFLTGTFANRHGVIDNETSEYNPEVTPPLTKYLQEAGYKTAMIGKWHMGENGEPRPFFDYWLSFKGQGVYHDPLFNINGEDIPFAGYTTDLLTEKAIDFIKNQPLDQPYFCMLSHKAVHEPFKPADRHKTVYGADTVTPEPISWSDTFKDKPDWLRRQQTRDYRWAWRTRQNEADVLPDEVSAKPWEKSKKHVNQLRCLAAVDEGLGKVIQTLKERGTLDNTIIVFTSDNGYFHLEHRRWDKRLAYEESLRIPMIVAYPNQIQPGDTIPQLVMNVDFAPTILDYAGVEIPEQMQGKSMKPLFEAEMPEWRDSIFYEYWKDLVHSIPTMTAVRTSGYKLIEYPDEDDISELYDLTVDPHEMNNLATNSEYKSLYKHMKNLLEEQKELYDWKLDVFPHNLPRIRDREGVLLDMAVSEGTLTNQASTSLKINQYDVDLSGNVMTFNSNSKGVQIAHDSAIDPSSWPYTIELSVNAETDGVIVSHAGPGSGFTLFVQDGRPGISILCKTWIASQTTIDAKESIHNEWTDIKATIDYNRVTFYIDGIEVDSVALPQPFKRPTNKPLIIGSVGKHTVNDGIPQKPFNGSIRYIRITRVLAQ